MGIVEVTLNGSTNKNADTKLMRGLKDVLELIHQDSSANLKEQQMVDLDLPLALPVWSKQDCRMDFNTKCDSQPASLAASFFPYILKWPYCCTTPNSGTKTALNLLVGKFCTSITRRSCNRLDIGSGV
ncbi:uncharacterized protein LOC129314496 [Prosopis cineraria]|uniref:uncharacterized protein LOC129314496 n=1 Tax=Prosopis cineraria TaxID=364024 RepID=UPI00241039E4|nr:uncharacterized protein LOC129314496 [Prosopis cineraria]